MLTSNEFSLAEISEIKLPAHRTLKVTDDDIDGFLDYRKGNYTFIILSFLDPNLKYGHLKFHQGHIYPASQFTDAKLNTNNIDFDKYRLF
ncbi:hypothetical protein [Trichormus azollae]|jgi:hypothetical protein|uniref:Uncharacterized protein n=1 Tax=Nostoc azollae (strain 0708) TaxID=551115 RepID=D7E5D0_NOSA0|nr:hypothetical protein [Trichormus azollae]ADI65490.1 conserved hypothetical protein ['Nostoc azollae' 0708]